MGCQSEVKNIIAVVTISALTTRFFFSRNCLENFYGSASTELSEFSDSITMFFSAKEVELNVFAESDAVKASDDTIQITDSLHGMNDSTQQVQKASQEMTADSRIIMDQVVTLQEKTRTMQSSMDEMSSSASKMNLTSDALSEISELMEGSIEEIGKQVDQFKI